MNFLLNAYTLLWTLLFAIPGIIKSYSYAMTPYILAENPDMTVSDAITQSRRIMDGNKFRLFCLAFSFIGWALLGASPALIGLFIVIRNVIITQQLSAFLWLIPASIPTIIADLFLRPYQEATFAAFYRDISATTATPDPALPESSTDTINGWAE